MTEFKPEIILHFKMRRERGRAIFGAGSANQMDSAIDHLKQVRKEPGIGEKRLALLDTLIRMLSLEVDEEMDKAVAEWQEYRKLNPRE